jgi:hypothetical protein
MVKAAYKYSDVAKVTVENSADLAIQYVWLFLVLIFKFSRFKADYPMDSHTS